MTLWTHYKVSLIQQLHSQKLSKLIDPCGTTLKVPVITNKVKVKVKSSLEQATKAQRVSRGIALPFHDLSP